MTYDLKDPKLIQAKIKLLEEEIETLKKQTLPVTFGGRGGVTLDYKNYYWGVWTSFGAKPNNKICITIVDKSTYLEDNDARDLANTILKILEKKKND